jgi:hypothetical protein
MKRLGMAGHLLWSDPRPLSSQPLGGIQFLNANFRGNLSFQLHDLFR